mmetsp:Transcript_48779/g.110697  ORF Transcript_48779/g.110697 Transcript_48779/m.110697 type:complete len:275 (+) Transcript_48779:139-963(+)
MVVFLDGSIPSLDSSADALWLAVLSGGLAMLGQVVLTLLFRESKYKAVADTAALAAHQVVALVFMVLATAVGGMAWWGGAVVDPGDAAGRLLKPCGVARWLAAVLAGELVVWDIPVGLAIPQLRKPDSLLHHVGMAAVAYCTVLFPTYYAVYYLGAIELSSIPLQLNDYCRLHRAAVEGPTRIPVLAALNGPNQLVTALAFLLVRLVSFSYVTIFLCMPDTAAVLRSDQAQQAGAVLPLKILFFLLTGFEALQLYWGWLHGRAFLRGQMKKKGN